MTAVRTTDCYTICDDHDGTKQREGEGDRDTGTWEQVNIYLERGGSAKGRARRRSPLWVRSGTDAGW